MYQISKKQLIEKILGLEKERNELLSLYLTANSLIKDSTSYITYLWSDKVDLEEEIIHLRESKKIKFNVAEEFKKIRTEVRELEEKENSTNGKEKS